MNRQKILQLADYVELHPEEFYLGEWVNECGSVGCFAWHSIKLEHPTAQPTNEKLFGYFITQYIVPETKETGWISEKAAEILGVDFYGKDSNVHPLFHEDDWLNGDMQNAFARSTDRAEKAQIAANYLRWYVANW